MRGWVVVRKEGRLRAGVTLGPRGNSAAGEAKCPPAGVSPPILWRRPLPTKPVHAPSSAPVLTGECRFPSLPHPVPQTLVRLPPLPPVSRSKLPPLGGGKNRLWGPATVHCDSVTLDAGCHFRNGCRPSLAWRPSLSRTVYASIAIKQNN